MRNRNADDLYEEFSHFEVDSERVVPHIWPSPQGLFGRAVRLGYFSDKFDEEWREYTHIHGKEHLHGTDKTVYPAILQQFQHGMTEPWKKQFSYPTSNEFADLGYVLDLQYYKGSIYDEPLNIDYKDKAYIEHGDTSNLPILGGDAKRNLLLIAPRDGSFSILLWSPILRITERGIIN